MTIEQLKNLNAARADLDDLVAMSVFARNLVAEYEHLNLDEPEWLSAALKTVRREIKSRNADRLESQLAESRARLENLKTPTERKAELRKTIQRLEAELVEVG